MKLAETAKLAQGDVDKNGERRWQKGGVNSRHLDGRKI